MPGPIITAVIVPAQAHAHTRLFIESFPPLTARFLLPDRLREYRSVNPDTIARRRATPHIRPFDRIRYAIVTGRGGRSPETAPGKRDTPGACAEDVCTRPGRGRSVLCPGPVGASRAGRARCGRSRWMTVTSAVPPPSHMVGRP